MTTKYEIINGRRFAYTPLGLLPGITTVLSETKSEYSKKAIQAWREKQELNNTSDNKLNEAIDRGLLLHKEIEVTLKEGRQEIYSSPFADQALSFLEKISNIQGIEKPIYHPIGFQSSVDLFADLEGLSTVIDWKTAGKDSAIADPKKRSSRMSDYYLQISAYCKALEYLGSSQINQAAIVLFIEEQKTPLIYKINLERINKYWDKFKERMLLFNQISSFKNIW